MIGEEFAFDGTIASKKCELKLHIRTLIITHNFSNTFPYMLQIFSIHEFIFVVCIPVGERSFRLEIRSYTDTQGVDKKTTFQPMFI